LPSTTDRRQFLKGAAAAGALAVLPAADAAAGRRRRSATADLLVVGGSVLTMDRRFRVAEAVAIRRGEILEVGRTRDLRRLADRRTQIVDAKGGTVLPGINDSHLHASSYSLNLPPLSVNVDTGTMDELVAVVREAVTASGPGTSWVRGGGWNENRLPKAPTRAELDPVSGEHPVILTSFDAHAVAVNSKALTLAGITRDTQPPPGGVIEKDASGEPTGVLREGAQGLVRRVVPPFTSDEIEKGLLSGIDLLHAFGITSLTDPGIGLDTLALLSRLSRNDKLPMRINVLLSAGPSVASATKLLAGYKPSRGVDDRLLRVAGMKIFGDGIPTAAQTAWLKEPYLDGRNGSLTVDGASIAEQLATLNGIIAVAHKAGMQIGTHATGDATIDAVVAGYLKAMRAHRRRDPRHYVIHGDLTPKATLKKMAKHDIGVNMNATIKFVLGRTLDGVLGPERTDYQWPYRSALQAGVRVSSASDAPVTDPNWLQGVSSAILRRGQFGGVAGTAERIGLRDALHTYTSTPAWQDRAEDWKGTLEPGKAADVVVVSGDVRETDPAKLTDLEIETTILAGKVVYEKNDSSKATLAALGLQRSRHDRARTCLHAGGCCCTMTRDIMAGNV
jgi:predicted amidohydrolase YtcJ